MSNKKTQLVKVITDSVAQVPEKTARQLGITVVPFTVTINDEIFIDGVNLLPGDLYHRMRVEKVIPKTSAPAPGSYIQTLQDSIRAGAKSILFIALTSNLSASYYVLLEAAKQVREEHPEVQIEVFDSKQAAISEGFIAIEAARAARQGMDMKKVIRVARETQKKVGIVVSFDTLEYLALGGRIGKAAYLMGNLIDIKPIITLDEEGLVTPIGKVRGNRRAFDAIIKYVAEKATGKRHLTLALMDADAPERVEELKKLVLQRLKPDELIHTSITPVMGAHTGPGLVGLGYFVS